MSVLLQVMTTGAVRVGEQSRAQAVSAYPHGAQHTLSDGVTASGLSLNACVASHRVRGTERFPSAALIPSLKHPSVWRPEQELSCLIPYHLSQETAAEQCQA